MDILFLIIGILVGFAAAWFIAKFKFSGDKGLSLQTIGEQYIRKEVYETERKEKDAKEEQLRQLNDRLARTETENKYLQERIIKNNEDLEERQRVLRLEFTNMANSLLEEKSKRFVEINEKNMSDILNPLREKIKDFEQKVDETYKEETRERISLKTEIAQIVKLNLQVSEDTNRLTSALKGDKKLQGNWGEVQLEMILEKAGLEDGIHYFKQQSLRNEDNDMFRPDFIINMPDNKNLVLDSKLSLVAYENYYNTEDEILQAKFLKEHLAALNKHINELGAKNYSQLYGINSPDYVMMFVALEPALTAALKQDLSLYEKALDKNIVLVSSSTLLATLRTISYIWKQENQKRNVVEIAKESGALYDKFVGFMDDLIKVGRSMDDTQKTYREAMNKLVDSPKKGDTIIGRFERIKKLGANASKSLPQNLIDRIE
ncbi:MAG: DNA recombination protein RmuC [Paludibacteraceae bacterium]|nr:DNA recombination protein RmuC [Paludibacteraceae bacterium]